MDATVSFENINGKKIFNIFTRPGKSTKKVVIMSHGFRGSSVGPARTFVDFEKHLLKEGFSVLRFDQPCGGNSEGEYIDSSFNEWINTTSYFAEKYLSQGYKVTLLGQSMGATTTMIVAGQEKFKGKIPCIILWVPDAKSGIDAVADEIYEEGGQKYKGKFWLEARDADFFDALKNYTGGIHLVYGEYDKYVTEEIRTRTIEEVKKKGQETVVLPHQDHSPWEYDVSESVFKDEIKFLRKYFQ